ncbi:MAG: acyl-CoA dehydrogenase, partial [Actinomycetota bacterium]
IDGSGPSGPLPAGAQSGTTENNFRDQPGEFADVDAIWHYGYLFAPALTLGGGTFAVQRNIVAEQVLGLPREPDVERGLTWSETRTRTP